MKVFIITIITLTNLFAAFDASEFTAKPRYSGDLTPKEAYTQMQEDGDIIVLDVREAFQFLRAHIKSAVNIPAFKTVDGEEKVNNSFVDEVVYKLDDDTETKIFVYCRRGLKSVYASNQLADYGFDNVYNIVGGVNKGWKPSNLPLER
jgi:rhodanese-related sulfurtransferase